MEVTHISSEKKKKFDALIIINAFVPTMLQPADEDLEVDHIILLTKDFMDPFESSMRAHKGWLKH